MKTKFKFLFIVRELFLYTSCKDCFVSEIDKYDELLFVEECITDASEPYTITHSESAKIQELAKSISYAGSKLSITDNLGKIIIAADHGEVK